MTFDYIEKNINDVDKIKIFYKQSQSYNITANDMYF